MSDLVFGQTPPKGHVTVSRPHRPTPCDMPHFTRDGDPKTVPGMVHRHARGSQVLCRMHGQQLVERLAAS